MKTFLKLLLLIVLAGYLIYAFIYLGNNKEEEWCNELKVTITDSRKAGFITPAEVERLLNLEGLNPVGLLMDSIDGIEIEQLLLKNSFVKGATFFKMPGGKVNIIVEQRLPILRIMPAKGQSYYIDERGEAMEKLDYNANLAVATGSMDSTIIHDDLVKLGLYLRENSFWNDQITQIDVKPNRNIDLITRVGGNIIIHLGTTDSLVRKFNNLKTFYEKVMPEVGWNTYKEIDLGYNHQIVCKKR